MVEDLKLPSSINILGHWVKISYVDDIPGSREELVYGLFELEKNKITIKKSNPEEMYRTLIHEISHALFGYSGLGQVLNGKQEEAICCLTEYFTKLFTMRKTNAIRWRKTRVEQNSL
jgi:hypothetical protein